MSWCPSDLDLFRYSFYKCHKDLIQQGIGGRASSIETAPVDMVPFQRFVARASELKDIPITLSYHGTATANVDSICSRGLLVPRDHNGVFVRHGTAYGRGVYTSENPSYSLSYGSSVFVCAILDDTTTLSSNIHKKTVRNGGNPGMRLTEGRLMIPSHSHKAVSRVDKGAKPFVSGKMKRKKIKLVRIKKRPTSKNGVDPPATTTPSGYSYFPTFPRDGTGNAFRVGGVVVLYRESHVLPLFLVTAKAAANNSNYYYGTKTRKIVLRFISKGRDRSRRNQRNLKALIDRQHVLVQ